MDVETRVGLQGVVKPWSAVFDRGMGLELMGEVFRGEIANTLVFERGLRFEIVDVGVIERGVRVALQPLVVGKGLRVESVERVVEILCVVNLPLLGSWTATSNTDSLVVSSVASSMGQAVRSMKPELGSTVINSYLHVHLQA